jgi:hypothetical protein
VEQQHCAAIEFGRVEEPGPQLYGVGSLQHGLLPCRMVLQRVVIGGVRIWYSPMVNMQRAFGNKYWNYYGKDE